MSVPCNKQDYERFKKLADLLAAHKPPVELRIYVSKSGKAEGGSYVSLEMSGHIDAAKVAAVFNEADDFQDEPARAPEDLGDGTSGLEVDNDATGVSTT